MEPRREHRGEPDIEPRPGQQLGAASMEPAVIGRTTTPKPTGQPPSRRRNGAGREMAGQDRAQTFIGVTLSWPQWSRPMNSRTTDVAMILARQNGKPQWSRPKTGRMSRPRLQQTCTRKSRNGAGPGPAG